MAFRYADDMAFHPANRNASPDRQRSDAEWPLSHDYAIRPRSGSFSSALLQRWLGGIEIDQAQTAAPLRFSLWELLVAMTAAAVLLALFRALGIVGAAASFVAALALTYGFYPAINRGSPARQEAMFDFVWGALMPVVCLAFDPFVFKVDEPTMLAPGMRTNPFAASQLYPWSCSVYAIVAVQVAAIGIWIVLGRLKPAAAAVMAGVLWLGFALACMMGVILFLPAVLGSFAAVGVLGFTPLFTARAYYRRALQAGAVAARGLPAATGGWLALAGYWAALAGPVVAGGMLTAWLWSRGLQLPGDAWQAIQRLLA